MNWLQSVGLTLILYVAGNAVIAAADLTEPTQAMYRLVLSIGGLILMLGGVRQDKEE